MSNTFILTIVDSGGIQDYIFGSNKLQLNLAASYLVDATTRAWVKEALDKEKIKHNIDAGGFDSADPFLPNYKIESGVVDAEVIMAGGGNTQILFRDMETAKRFTRYLSRKVLTDAPGLKITVIHQSFDWESEQLGGKGGVVEKAFKALAKRKMQINPLPPTLGLGVTVQDIYTGLPAVGFDKDGNGVSAEINAKLRVVKQANHRLEDALDMEHGYKFPWQFEDLGQKEGESNYIAVVHADGNGMGNRIREEGDKATDNRDYVVRMRAFSQSIRKAALETLQETVDKLVEIAEDDAFRERVHLKDKYLPFRPIVFGGDDITFVAEGRLGLTLAAFYLQKFNEKRYSDGEPAYVRAGVAIVKSHYPFARAYDLAEALAQSAKQRIPKDGKAVAMDWHIASLGPIFSLKEIRDREYATRDGKSLLMRPVLISPKTDWRTWETMESIVAEFNEKDIWRERHNKVMRLRSALRQGPNAVKHFRAVYNVGLLPEIKGLTEKQSVTVREEGWLGDICPYFDAIETKDFFILLKRSEESNHA